MRSKSPVAAVVGGLKVTGGLALLAALIALLSAIILLTWLVYRRLNTGSLFPLAKMSNPRAKFLVKTSGRVLVRSLVVNGMFVGF